MSGSRWEKSAMIIIQRIIDENPGKDNAELRKIVSAQYPWGPRENHPYRMWLRAVKKVLGDGRPPLTSDSVRHMWVKQ